MSEKNTQAEKHCMNCAAFGECHPNNDAGRCGYELDQPTQAEAPSDGWHTPGLGEVHSPDHKQMIYCEAEDVNGEMVASDGLARRVRAALATQQAGQGEAVAWIANDTGYNYVQWKENTNLPVGTKLYATPPAPQQPEALAQQERVREPMTDEQIEDARQNIIPNAWHGEIDAFTAGVRQAERFHAIRAARSSEGGKS